MLIADEAKCACGMRIAGCEFPTHRLETWISPTPRHCCIPGSARAGQQFPRSEAKAPSVAAATWKPSQPSNDRSGTDAILFSPLNKTSLYARHGPQRRVAPWFAGAWGSAAPAVQVLDTSGPR